MEGTSPESGRRGKKRRHRTTSFEPVTNTEDIHSLGQIPITVPRKGKAPPALRAARTEFRAAVAERDLAQTELDSARRVAEEAQRRLSEAENRSYLAEDRFYCARSAVEELDLQNPTVKWNEMFAKLEAFKARHGHCRLKSVPEEFASNRDEMVKLDNWLSRQRFQYQKCLAGETTTVKPHRIVALERLGVFVGKWQEKYDSLLAFKEEHGHCDVPTRSYKDQKLGYWVGFQRTEYKKLKDGKKNNLTPERLKLLQDIGFSFNTYEAKGIVRKRKCVDTEKDNETIQVGNGIATEQNHESAVELELSTVS